MKSIVEANPESVYMTGKSESHISQLLIKARRKDTTGYTGHIMRGTGQSSRYRGASREHQAPAEERREARAIVDGFIISWHCHHGTVIMTCDHGSVIMAL